VNPVSLISAIDQRSTDLFFGDIRELSIKMSIRVTPIFAVTLIFSGLSVNAFNP